MSGPWEKYQQPAAGPWTRYAQPAPPAAAAANAPDRFDQYIADTAATPPAPDPEPSVFRMDSDFRERAGVGAPAMQWAAAKDMFGSRGGAAEFLASQSGGTVEQTPEGETLIVLGDGTRYRLNDPGLDSADLGSLAGNIGAQWTPAGWAARFGTARNLGMGARAMVQGATGAAVDTGLQAGFDNGRVNPLRSAAAAVGGAGGEVVGTGLTKLFEAVRPMLNQGSIRAAAEKLAADAGVTDLSQAQLTRLALGMREIQAGADPRAVLGREEFGFLYTQGQRMAEGNPRRFDQLAKEELLRQAPGSADVLRRAEAHNADQLGMALDRMGASENVPTAANPAELVRGVAERVRGQADELDARVGAAYDEAAKGNRSAVGADAVRTLPDRLRNAVREFDVNPETMPVTARALTQVRNATDLILRAGEGSNVSGVTLGALETQRRIINNAINAAGSKADRAAMVALKREYDRWLDDSVENALVSGDPSALALLKNARGLRAEFGRRFEGGADSDRFIAGLIDGSRTPEELLNMALGAGQVSKTSGARFIERLRVAANNDPAVMEAMKAANFMRLTRGADGKPLNMGQIVRNIRSAENSNASVMRALYTDVEWAEIRRLADALEPLLSKGQFARTSGTGERLARMFFQRMGGSGLPILGPVVEAAAAGRRVWQAGKAVNDPVRVPLRAMPGLVPGGEALMDDQAR